MTFLALQILVEVPDGTAWQDLSDKIEEAAAGHNCALDSEEQCRLRWFATSSHHDPETASAWLHNE